MKDLPYNSPSVFVHIVTHNDEATMEKCLDSLLVQSGFVLGKSLFVSVLDNASTDSSVDIIRNYAGQVLLECSGVNLGFCGGQNRGVAKFLDSGAEYLLILNPDTVLPDNSLKILLEKFSEYCSQDHSVGLATPKLLRLSDDKKQILDSTGMIFLPTFRHLDRGAGEEDVGMFDREEFVSGGTGACLCLHRECVKSLIVPYYHSESLLKIYPQLENFKSRAQLFDEAFFAYRDDADLALRAALFGWKTLYVPTSRIYHIRKVTPERRKELSDFINCLGVRNRFLLQLNNYFPSRFSGIFLQGIVLRNILVICGVLLRERSSLKAFYELWILLRRSLANRKFIHNRSRELCGHSVENVFL
jgi:GT2 family glycosyltransferase